MKRKIGLAVAVILLVSLSGAAFGGTIADNQVTSQHIAENDNGASGQDPNSGTGIKSAHIAPEAVIESKISAGAVTTQKIGDNQITTQKLADGVVTSQKLGDASVTDAKIAGPISASKISSVGLNADTVDGLHAADLAQAVHTHSQSQVTGLESALAGKADVTHNHDTLYQQKYGKVAVVAQTGGDYSDPLTAMNNLSAWCGTPSATNPCLLKIMPGVYNIGVNSLQMSEYVDIEGSGENSTKITGTASSEWAGVLNGASNAEVRLITIESTGSGAGSISTAVVTYYASTKMSNMTASATGGQVYNIAIHNNSGGPQMTNVTARAVGAGINLGISTQEGGLIIKNSSVIADNSGIALKWASAEISGVTVSSANYGVDSLLSTIRIDQSQIKGGVATVEAYGGTIYVGNSKLDGAPTHNDGSTILRCAGIYDEDYNFYASTCP